MSLNKKIKKSSPGKFVKIKRKFMEKAGSASAAADRSARAKKINKFKINTKKSDIVKNEKNSSNTIFNEILNEVKLHQSRKDFIQNWFEKIKKFLEKLPAQKDNDTQSNTLWINKNVHFPLIVKKLNLPKKDFQFYGITSCQMIGSYALGTAIDDGIANILIEIPEQAFSKKSYKNMEYHQIRAFYLSYLAKKLSKWTRISDVKFLFFNGNHFHPIIMIQSSDTYQDEYLSFYIHAVCKEETFKLNRFLPSIKNVNHELFKDLHLDQLQASYSPHYNASIAMDLAIKENQSFLSNTIELYDNVKNGLILIKTWLKARGLNEGFTGFSGYIASMFVAYLIVQRKLNLSMEVEDICRVFWLDLVNSKWNENQQGISLHANQINLDGFHKYFDVVFVDATGYLNLCANLSLEMYRLVQDECKHALNLMHKPEIKQLFLNKHENFLKYDHILNIKNIFDFSDFLVKRNSTEYFFDYCCTDWYPAFTNMLTNLLEKGLKNRVRRMIPIPSILPPWNINETCPENMRIFSLGLYLNPVKALEVMDKGPQANQTEEADEFKKFWGNKSELRRFQDGSVIEACLWKSPTAPLSERRLISKEIVLHLLDHHFDIKRKKINYVASQFDSAYTIDIVHSSMESEQKIENCENLALNVVKSFTEVTKCLRSIESIPLDISSILGVSPIFRYTEIQPVFPNAKQFSDGNTKIFQSYVTNEAVIQFALSGQWPTELNAIKRVKAALFLQFAKELRKQYQQISVKVNPDNIEILKDGYVFRFYIALHKELLLMKKQKSSKGILKYRDTCESLEFEKKFFLKPKLNVLLHTLYHNNNSFGPAVLIAKRWLYSQLIDAYLWPDECTELIMAHLYTEDHTENVPIQPQTGFFRFLHLLVNTDWNAEMLLINFGKTLNDDEITKIRTRFTSDRDSFPQMCIVTSGDEKKYSIWTKLAPTREIIARAAILSQHALYKIEKDISSLLLAKPFFFASTEGYDVLITLRKTHVHTCYLHDFGKYTSRKQMIDQQIPAADFDPVQCYLNELRKAYSDFAIFFYNPCGGLQIGVVWKPSVYVKHDFESSNLNGMHMVQNGKSIINLRQIVEDFRIVGFQLVELVTVAEK